MTHIFGFERSQLLLLPEAVDDYVGVDNPVRFIDQFVDGLDLATAGFNRVTPKTTARPGYAPADLLKLYIYGYSGAVEPSAVERASTSEIYCDRVLGVTESATAPAYTVQAFTGNNISPKGDLASRSLIVSLAVDRPDPENRPFAHPDPDDMDGGMTPATQRWPPARLLCPRRPAIPVNDPISDGSP